MMGFLPRPRRAAPEPHALTVAPFDAAGAGVGDVPPTVAIETPDAITALIIYTEPERADAQAFERCAAAVRAFRIGYDEADGQAVSAALVAGIEAANDTLYAPLPPRAPRDGRRMGVGLTALAVRGGDAFVIQAGPGQALIAGGDALIALPPLDRRPRAVGGYDDDHPPALGLNPALEPNLFHIDASGGLCATLCHSALALLLGRGDDAPLRSFDAQAAAAHLVHLGERYHVANACGVVVSADATADVIVPMPPHRPPRPAYPPTRRGPRGSAFAPPPANRHTAAWFDDAGDADDGWEAGASEWMDEESYPPTGRGGDARHVRTGSRTPIRLMMLIVALVCTLAIFLGVTIVRAWTAHQENVRAIQQLDDIEGDRAQAEIVAQHDTTSAYAILEPLVARLDAVARSGRQTRRVQQEEAQLAKTFDRVGNVTRVAPKLIGSLDHLDGAVGNHRLALVGDDGQLYLYDKDERGAWALYNYDVISGRRGVLFTQGQIAVRTPSGELRGVFWSGGPATSDPTRLFVRTTNGSWAEIALQNLPNRRPAAMAMANDTVYFLDTIAGAIVRISLRDGNVAKHWTDDGAVADLKNAVDLTADGQTVWVLLADGRVRGFSGASVGTGAAVIAPAALPPFRGAVAIATSATSPYVYVAEGGGGRILRIRKADGKLMQALRSTGEPAPSLDTVQGMAVDEAHGVLWCVTADGILSFPLPPVGG